MGTEEMVVKEFSCPTWLPISMDFIESVQSVLCTFFQAVLEVSELKRWKSVLVRLSKEMKFI